MTVDRYLDRLDPIWPLVKPSYVAAAGVRGNVFYRQQAERPALPAVTQLDAFCLPPSQNPTMAATTPMMSKTQ